MSDGGWTLGLLTWAAIIGGAALFASATIRAIHRAPPLPLPPKVDYRAAAEKQAKEAAQRLRDDSGIEMTEADWFHYAAGRLREHWPEIDYDEALRLLREYLADCDQVFADPDYEWTWASAREFADEYMREVGEEESNA